MLLADFLGGNAVLPWFLIVCASLECSGVRSDTSKLENCGDTKCALKGRSAKTKKRVIISPPSWAVPGGTSRFFLSSPALQHSPRLLRASHVDGTTLGPQPPADRRGRAPTGAAMPGAAKVLIAPSSPCTCNKNNTAMPLSRERRPILQTFFSENRTLAGARFSKLHFPGGARFAKLHSRKIIFLKLRFRRGASLKCSLS